jgi:hypothetical protein
MAQFNHTGAGSLRISKSLDCSGAFNFSANATLEIDADDRADFRRNRTEIARLLHKRGMLRFPPPRFPKLQVPPGRQCDDWQLDAGSRVVDRRGDSSGPQLHAGSRRCQFDCSRGWAVDFAIDSHRAWAPEWQRGGSAGILSA